jgi:hypothetical protein
MELLFREVRVDEVEQEPTQRDQFNIDRVANQHDTFCVAAWFACADRDGTLAGFLKPELSPAERP